jgi:ABC-type sugar transport system permease subunit
MSAAARALPRAVVAPWMLIAPFAIAFLAFSAYPLVQSLSLSMHQSFGPAHSKFVGIDNYRFLLADPLFWKAVRNTLVFTAGSVFIQLPLALALALLLNRSDVRGRAFFRLIFFSPVLVGVVFVAMMFAVIFEKRTGLANQAIHSLTTSIMPPRSRFIWSLDFPWLSTYAMPALIIASLWQYVGFNMVYFLAALQNVDRELIEASTVDGAGAWSRFRNVIIPAIRPVGTFVVLLSIIGSFQLFELPFVLLNSSAGPNNEGLTVVMYLYQKGFDTGDLGYASAVGWVLAIILIAFAVLQKRVAREEEVAR